ncbi:MAG: cache domain-containing protein, partial [Bacteroidota bacterium]|nr:cache domain-containing protein [Bacteroidota bacterium]
MRKIIAFSSIKGRLTFWLLVLGLLPLFVGLLISYNQEKQAIENDSFAKLASIRDLKVQQVENWLDERIGDVLVMSGDLEIRGLEKIFEKQTKSADDLQKIEVARELLNRNQKNYRNYEEIFMVGANNGLIELSNDISSEGSNKSQDLCFTAPMESGKVYIKDIYFSQALNRPQMTISSPIYCLEHGNHIIGILVVRINLEQSLYVLLNNRVGLGETGETLIVNKDVVALNELRWYDDASTKLQISAEPAVKAAQGETGIIVSSDYRGEKVLAAYAHISRTGWGFVCKQDAYELNSIVRDMVKNYIILLVLSLLLIVLVVFLISRALSKPIVDIDAATRKVIGGDYSVRTFVSSKDELASLANSINEMTASIESRIITQKAVADISEMVIGQSSMEGFGSKLLKLLMEITGANMSTFYILNEGSSVYEHFSSIGANAELLQPFNANNPEGEFGIVLSKKSIHYVQNIPEDTIFKFQTTAGDAVPREIITIPVLVENRVVALISLVNMHKFSKDCYDILKQSWTSINTSYSALMSNERTRILA